MYKGDISNDMPKRILVLDELVILKKQIIEKKFKFLPVVGTELGYDRLMLNKFYVYTTQRGVTLELISFDLNQEQLEAAYNQIDNVGTNPFRYCTAYKSPAKLVGELPFRPEVVGVLDPSRQTMYGHWGIDL
jgi:hypothetical protein